MAKTKQPTKPKASKESKGKKPAKEKQREKSPSPEELPPLPPPTDQEILFSHSKNAAECCVIVPTGNNWVNNAKHLAAYLGFDFLGNFRTWLKIGASDNGVRVADILQSFLDLYENNFSKPATKENTRTNISQAAVWTEITSNNLSLAPLFQSGVQLPPVDVATPGSKVFPIACHIAAMSQLIQTNPTFFVESHAMMEEGEAGFHRTGMSSEDLQRAFWVLKFHLRHKSGAKEKKGFYESKEAGALHPARYYTPEDLKRCLAAQSGVAIGDEAEAAHPVETYLAAEREVPIETEDMESDDRMFDQKLEDSDKLIELISDMVGQTTREVDTRRVGRVWERAPLNLAAQRSLCKEMGRRVKILHESDWVKVKSDDPDVLKTLGSAEDIPLNRDPDQHTVGETPTQTKFWKLLNDITGISARTDTYEEACSELNINPDEPKYPADNPTLTLNPWQVAGLRWGINQEICPVRGGIIADSCGIGKTIQMLAIIHQRSTMRVQNNSQPYRPTLILCPSPIVEVWYAEVTKWFPSLKIMRWYESPEKQRTAHIRDDTLGTKLADCLQFLDEKCAVDNPRSEFTIIVSSYETFQGRAIELTPTPGKQTTGFWIDDPDTPEGELIDLKFTYSTQLRGRFNRVVLDEGHKVKNAQTIIAHLISLLICPYRWILTATPMLNRAIDFLGYLNMLWSDFMALDPEEDPPSNLERYTEDVVPETTLAYLPGGPADWKKWELPLWRLNPFSFRRLVNEQHQDISVYQAHVALRGIIPLIMMRRTQATEMMVGGEAIRIGNSIPIYEICTVELDFASDAAFKVYHDAHKKYAKLLSQSGSIQNTPTKVPAPRKKTGPSIGRNFAIHRRLSLLTFNPAFESLLSRVGLSHAADVEKWYTRHQDHGMSLYFDATKPDKNLPPYTDRYAFGIYLTKDSPKLLYLGYLVGEICLGPEPRRVLVYADWPMSQWHVEGVLKNIGFNVVSLRSSMDATERARAIERFNDPQSDVQVLVTSLKVSTFGLNLQGCCSDLIVMGVADNVNAMLQVIGRIHRLGQTREQKVWVLTLTRSYDNLLQHTQTVKMLQQMAGEANLEAQVTQKESDSFDPEEFEDVRSLGRSIRLACEQLIQQLLGQRRSRAPKYWRDMIDLEKPRRIELGLDSDNDSPLSSPSHSPVRQLERQNTKKSGPAAASEKQPANKSGPAAAAGKQPAKKSGPAAGKQPAKKSGPASAPAASNPPPGPESSTAQNGNGGAGSKRKRKSAGGSAPATRQSKRVLRAPPAEDTWYEQAPRS